jgi:hypothetical protein
MADQDLEAGAWARLATAKTARHLWMTRVHKFITEKSSAVVLIVGIVCFFD